MKKKSIAVIVALVLVMVSLVGCGNSNSAQTSKASAADWPKKTIQLVVPFKAGGDSDFNARTYAKYLEKELGVSVVVVNIEGGGGSIGATQAKESANDGYTIFLGDVALALNEAAGLIDFGYESFEVVGVVGKAAGEFLTVRADMPVNTVQELIDLTKKEPNKYKLAANTGATTHYAASVLRQLGTQFNVVNSGSSAERVAALKGGHIDAMFNSMGTIKAFIESGEFKALGNAASERAKAYPDIPTLKEQGIELSYDINYNMLLPKGTDKSIAIKINEACQNVAKNPAYAEDIFKAYGQAPYVLSIEDSIKVLKGEREKFMAFKDEFSTGK
jgi:tripartite-type tricarboxylate transporter receptor subunit TctC